MPLDDDETWMLLALAEARRARDEGAVPVVAVLVARPAPPPPPAARLQRIGVMRGLTPPKQGLDAPTLAAYTRPLRAALEAHFAETWSPSPQDLVVHVELHAGRAPMIDFALNPGPAHAALNGLHRALMAVSAPEVTAPVVLRIYYALWGGVTVDGPPPAER